MMKLQIILANFCVLVVNFTFIYGFPVPLSLPKDNAKQIQKHNRVNGADKKKPKDSKTKLRIEEWQRIMNNIDPGKLQKIGDNHYGLTGASADIQNDILRRIIENHLKKLRKVTAKNSLNPSGIKTNAKKDSGEHTDESALHSKNEKGQKQKKIDFTVGPQKSIGDEYSTTNRQSGDEKTESEATTLKAEGTTPKLIEIVAYPISYTQSMSSTFTSSAPSSSSTFSLTSTSTSSSSQSLSSSSTVTIPSSSSSVSTSSSSSLSSQTTGKTSSSSSTSLSFSKYSTTASSATSSSGTFFQTQSQSSSLSSSLSSTSSISLTSSSSLLWTLISSQTSSSTASSVSSVSSLITASSSSTSSETSVPLSPSLLPQPHILHIKLVNNKTSENR